MKATVTPIDTSSWPDVDVASLPSAHQSIFLKRKEAIIILAAGGRTIRDVAKQCGLREASLPEWFDLCMVEDKDGKPLGFVAIIPFRRRNGYRARRKAKARAGRGGHSGQFERLLDQLREEDADLLKDTINDILKCAQASCIVDPRTKKKPRVDKSAALKRFHRRLRKKGFTDDNYPFCAGELGARTFCKYFDRVLREHVRTHGAGILGPEARNNFISSGPNCEDEISKLSYQWCEIDEYKFKACFVITFTDSDGSTYIKVFDGFWVIALICVPSRAVLGWHAVLSPSFTADDFLEAIENAIRPWRPRELCIDGLGYPIGSGLPSGVIEDAAWALPVHIRMDNARQHLANAVRQNLPRSGITLDWGPSRVPQDRPFIERFFGLLNARVASKLSVSTQHVREARKVAERYEVSFEELCDLVDVAFAQGNATIHSAHGLTPLEFIQRDNARQRVLRHVAEADREGFCLVTVTKVAVVRGNLLKGQRPYVQWAHGIYTSERLSLDFELLKTRLKLVMKSKDGRTVEAYLADGSHYDTLKADGIWGRKLHSLRTRQTVFRMLRHSQLKGSEHDDLLEIYEKHLTRKAPKNKHAARSLARHNKAKGAQTESATPTEHQDGHFGGRAEVAMTAPPSRPLADPTAPPAPKPLDSPSPVARTQAPARPISTPPSLRMP